MPAPCRFVWSVALNKWVPDESNGLACPAEEHCEEPQYRGTVDGTVEYTFCTGGESAAKREKKKPKGNG